MVKSTSCFKIITCGSDSKDKDDIEVSEAKGSSDKRGWSFRKRSARHRVLSNTVISETPSSANKESPEDVNINYQQPANSTVLEKISVIQSIDEKPQLSTSVETKVIETVVPTENENKLDLYKEESVIIVENKLDVYAEESVIIVIQAAIRGFLGQRMLLKLKNVVKLQAAVRGYLVRSHAVGTLRCVQAIAKMQALVRARRARLSLEGSYPENKLGGKHENDTDTSKTWEKEKLAMESNVTYTSIEKLLSNGFARQLLESTPKTKPIHVKCDPSKHDSAWKWLERWMSVSSPDIVESKKAEPITEKQVREQDENLVSHFETEIPSEVFPESKDAESNNRESLVPSESEDNLITYDPNDFNFQAYNPTSLSEDDLDQPRPESINTSDAKETLLDMISLPNQSTQADSNSQVEFNFLPVKPETETEQPKRSMKRLASEQLDTEEKKCVFGSRKPSNPAFIAAQSKFEELSTITSAGKDAEVESNIDTTLSGASTVIRTKELGIAENSTPHSSRIQVGGSECGTELSISSTLDSPDISEVGAPECDHEAKVLEDGIYNPNSMKNMVVESKDESSVSISNLSPSVLDKPENLGDVNGESVNLMVTTDTPLIEPKPEKDASADLQRQLDSETGHQPYRTSPEASPRSHITMPESHGTPSSQVSVKSKKKRSDKSGSNQKPRSLSGGKKSPSNPNHDSGSRGSVEQLPREEKNGKRRNSFGSAKSDPIDQEPVESNTNSSLPHFMQATESARAKLQANNSPRSSPDVQDRDSYIKKRHSLPGANGRQGSPRILHSTSQAQQSAKGNVTYQHERKWQR
nr:protein IQ-DOMAIN 32 isoform X1 [Quercus suber]